MEIPGNTTSYHASNLGSIPAIDKNNNTMLSFEKK